MVLVLTPVWATSIRQTAVLGHSPYPQSLESNLLLGKVSLCAFKHDNKTPGYCITVLSVKRELPYVYIPTIHEHRALVL